MKHLLDFEKPISDLQHKLSELREHTEEATLEVNFDDEIRRMEEEININFEGSRIGAQKLIVPITLLLSYTVTVIIRSLVLHTF